MIFASINPITQGPIHEILMKKDWELVGLKNYLFFLSWTFFYFFPNEKQLGGLYEVSFISALWMISSESRKRLHPIYYAHDCTVASHYSLENQIWCLFTSWLICQHIHIFRLTKKALWIMDRNRGHHLPAEMMIIQVGPNGFFQSELLY